MEEDNSKKRKRDEESVPAVASSSAPSDFVDPDAQALEEPVQLMFEEAFFLSYVVQCLEVTRPDNVRRPTRFDQP
jgi:hypothetical protein